MKLWDVQERGELQTLLGGNSGNWIGVESRRRVFRGDDGTLLKKGRRNMTTGGQFPWPTRVGRTRFR